MGAKTKIDWADATWNPVTGCLHGCEYCYARRIAERFGGCDAESTYGMYHQATWRRGNPDSQRGEAIFEIDAKTPPINLRFDPVKQVMHMQKAPYPWGFQPTLHRDLLGVPQRWKKPRTVFVCSMADLFGAWVPDGWIREVMDACRAAPQHRYLFLTKNPDRYREADDWAPAHIRPKNAAEMWFGKTYTPGGDVEMPWILNTFLSVEPLLAPMPEEDIAELKHYYNWVIIGAETGNRKGKIVPERAWIEDIARACAEEEIPVFMKESLREIMGEDFRQEFPWG